MRALLAFLLLIVAAPVAAQEAPAAPKPATVRVLLTTELGPNRAGAGEGAGADHDGRTSCAM